MVSWYTVRIDLSITALIGLNVIVFNIHNAYLTVAGPEFVLEKGKIVLFVRNLCGLTLYGAAFRA